MAAAEHIYISASGTSSRLENGGWLLHIPLYILELHITTCFPASLELVVGMQCYAHHGVEWIHLSIGYAISIRRLHLLLRKMDDLSASTASTPSETIVRESSDDWRPRFHRRAISLGRCCRCVACRQFARALWLWRSRIWRDSR